jgi:hypothetical protein
MSTVARNLMRDDVTHKLSLISPTLTEHSKSRLMETAAGGKAEMLDTTVPRVSTSRSNIQMKERKVFRGLTVARCEISENKDSRRTALPVTAKRRVDH